MKMTQDEKYMKAAIREAKKAYALDEVPIGCVIVQDGTIIARGYNRRNTEGNTLAHAELTAITKIRASIILAVFGLHNIFRNSTPMTTPSTASRNSKNATVSSL